MEHPGKFREKAYQRRENQAAFDEFLQDHLASGENSDSRHVSSKRASSAFDSHKSDFVNEQGVPRARSRASKLSSGNEGARHRRSKGLKKRSQEYFAKRESRFPTGRNRSPTKALKDREGPILNMFDLLYDRCHDMESSRIEDGLMELKDMVKEYMKRVH